MDCCYHAFVLKDKTQVENKMDDWIIKQILNGAQISEMMAGQIGTNAAKQAIRYMLSDEYTNQKKIWDDEVLKTNAISELRDLQDKSENKITREITTRTIAALKCKEEQKA